MATRWPKSKSTPKAAAARPARHASSAIDTDRAIGAPDPAHRNAVHTGRERHAPAPKGQGNAVIGGR